ncbi:MAG: hypothetical protein R6T93_14560 [Trueperaceae bacterium]
MASTVHHARLGLVARFDRIDRWLSLRMARWGVALLRSTLGIVFIWFGLLKPLGLSAAEPLVLATVAWMPLFDAQTWLAVIGWWEVAIGVTFLIPQTLRIAIALLFLQMVGAFMPLVILSEVTFQSGGVPFAPTMEGQYIIKNLVIIAAALAVGGTVRAGPRLSSPAAGPSTPASPPRR